MTYFLFYLNFFYICYTRTGTLERAHVLPKTYAARWFSHSAYDSTPLLGFVDGRLFYYDQVNAVCFSERRRDFFKKSTTALKKY